MLTEEQIKAAQAIIKDHPSIPKTELVVPPSKEPEVDKLPEYHSNRIKDSILNVKEKKGMNKATSIKNHLNNKEVKCVRNLMSPEGCFVIIIRDGEGKPKEFQICFAKSKKMNTERADYRSSIANNPMETWVEFDHEEYLKAIYDKEVAEKKKIEEMRKENPNLKATDTVVKK